MRITRELTLISPLSISAVLFLVGAALLAPMDGTRAAGLFGANPACALVG